ncbi:uncharacterized protein LOC143672198 isoform X1 [Tamandua tetradactyla]|uniref:uncharacterized protein LOC143672198 isoform X1 n=1 Tax=Tamandua tetradactyla TaxID=48850 RepID=UPI0040546F76
MPSDKEYQTQQKLRSLQQRAPLYATFKEDLTSTNRMDKMKIMLVTLILCLVCVDPASASEMVQGPENAGKEDMFYPMGVNGECQKFTEVGVGSGEELKYYVDSNGKYYIKIAVKRSNSLIFYIVSVDENSVTMHMAEIMARSTDVTAEE